MSLRIMDRCKGLARRGWTAALLLLVVGCGYLAVTTPEAVVGGGDGGPADAAAQDATAEDRAAADLTVADVGISDRPLPDLGARDSTVVETGVDAAAPDVLQPDASVAWHDADYPCRLRVTIIDDFLPSSLVQFPLLVQIPRAALSCGGGPADPDRVRIAGLNGASRAYEREQSEPGQPFCYWVRHPSIDPASAGDALLLYFGAAVGVSPPDAGSVWPEPYRGVWHLDDDVAMAGLAHDATPLAHDGIATGGMDGTSSTAGQVGRALAFDGVNDRIAIGDPVDGSLDFAADAAFTYSLWVKVSGYSSDHDMPWSKGGASAVAPGYNLELGAGAWLAAVSDGTGSPISHFGDQTDFLGRWVYLAAVLDRSAAQLTVYVDGVATPPVSVPGLGSLASTSGATIGANDLAGNLFRGEVDEVRVVARARSAAWIEAQHRSMTGTLISVGVVEAQ